MNITEYKVISLGDIAEFERANDKITYPKGTVAIQVSATQGEVIYLEEDGKIESKYVVIKQNSVVPKYLFYMLQNESETFTERFKSGLNIQVGDLKNFELRIHNETTQIEIVRFMDHFTQELEVAKRQLEISKKVKQRLLEDMFV